MTRTSTQNGDSPRGGVKRHPSNLWFASGKTGADWRCSSHAHELKKKKNEASQ